MILFTSETKVLSVLIFDLKESGDVGAIAVLSLTMVVLHHGRDRDRQPHRRHRDTPQLRPRREPDMAWSTPGVARAAGASSGTTCGWSIRRCRADAILTLGSFDVQAAVHAAALWKSGPRAGDRHVGRHRPSRRPARHRLGPDRGARLRRGGDRPRACPEQAILLEERGAEHRRQLRASAAPSPSGRASARASCWSWPSPT